MSVQTVAEFTTNHAGHLGLLLRMVDAAADAGADWIKMQCKDVRTFYTQEKLAAEYPSPYGKTYRDYRTLFELDNDDWCRFDARCKANGIPWFCTVQDVASLEYMLAFGLKRYKVASSNARNVHFLEEVARQVPRECEIVCSVGGSTLRQVEDTLRIFNDHRRTWLLHCVAEYPCPLYRCRLGNIVELRRHFACDTVHIGYSGHEEGYLATLAAANLGAEMVERHFCMSRHSFVHHIECSLEPDEFGDMVRLVNGADEDRAGLCRQVPSAAYGSQFGMSGVERRFLVQQTYGQHYMEGGSTIG